MRRPVRIVVLTAGLALVSAVAGAVACWLALAGWDLAGTAPSIARDPIVLRAALPVGAGLGLVVGPPVAWAWLRRVPLGLTVGVPTLAATAGALASSPLDAIPFAWLWGALGGVALSVWWLRRRVVRPVPAGGRTGLPIVGLELPGPPGYPGAAIGSVTPRPCPTLMNRTRPRAFGDDAPPGA